jgi:hypothetical protein
MHTYMGIYNQNNFSLLSIPYFDFSSMFGFGFVWC